MHTSPSRRDLLKMFALASGSAMIGALPAMARASSPHLRTVREPAAATGQRKFTSRRGGSADRAHQGGDRRSRTGLAVRELLPEHARHHGEHRHARRQARHLHRHRRHRRDVDARFVRPGLAVPAAGAEGPGAAEAVPRADPSPGAVHRDRSLRQRLHARPARRAPRWTGRRRDITDMRPGVAERKWEIDSLCYPIRLAHGYWKTTGDTTPFDDDWRAAMHTVLKTFRVQQRKDGPGPYHFQRNSPRASENPPLDGYGNPGPAGRPDLLDVPAVGRCLPVSAVRAGQFLRRDLAAPAGRDVASRSITTTAFAGECRALADEVEAALKAYAVMHDEQRRRDLGLRGGRFRQPAFHGRRQCAQPVQPGVPRRDADRTTPRYRRTRALAWSHRNPYFFSGQRRRRHRRPARGAAHDLADVDHHARAHHATTPARSASACTGSRPPTPAPASCTRRSIRTTRSTSPAPGSPGPTPCSAN